ncbi:hypothetical protein ACVILI_002139 [Mesorhizobium sp. USDA 4775]
MQRHARFDLADRQVIAHAITAQHDGAARREPRQAIHCGARPFAHDVVKRAADQEEEQQRNGSVKIGVVAMVDGFVEAHGVGK